MNWFNRKMLGDHSFSTHAQISEFQTPNPLYAQIMTSLWQQYIGIHIALDPPTPLRCVRTKWMVPCLYMYVHLQFIVKTTQLRSYFTATCQQLTAYIAAAPDSALTASDTFAGWINNYGPARSRLFTPYMGVQTGGWVSRQARTTNKYLQVSSSRYLTALSILGKTPGRARWQVVCQAEKRQLGNGFLNRCFNNFINRMFTFKSKFENVAHCTHINSTCINCFTVLFFRWI